jgi:glycosyltransferase involved in cell wall biosynthesis
MTPDVIGLSVVLPCHAGAADVARSVTSLVAYLPSIAMHWEVIVVDDGGNDFAEHPLVQDPRVRLLRHARNLGKGAAVRTGMLAARGRVRVFTDADLPYDRELIAAMQHFISEEGFHLVIGDRTLPGSHYIAATGVRRLLSQVASWFIGSLVTGGFHDTQCGIKAMRGDVADLLFPLVRTPGFAFDVEVLYIALKHGLDLKRVPVRLRRNASSSVRPVRDALRAVRSILAIKGRQLQGAYGEPALAALVAGEVQEVLRRYGAGVIPR